MDELKAFADAAHLPRLLSGPASDKILLAIARQDYGRDVEKHLDLLKQIRGGHYSPDPRTHCWHPLEVMELTRWCEPGQPGLTLPLTVQDQHVARAFCCAIMLRIAGDYPTPGYMGDGNETLVQLVRSVTALGADVEMAAFLFLCWRLSGTAIIGEDDAFFAVATLYLYLRIASVPDLALAEALAARALTCEAAVRRRCTGVLAPGWLLPVSDYRQRHEAWRELFRELDALIAATAPDATSALYELQVQVGNT